MGLSEITDTIQRLRVWWKSSSDAPEPRADKHKRTHTSREGGGEGDVALARGGGGDGRDAGRAAHLGQLREVAGLLEVFREYGAHPAPHAPERTAGEAGGPGGEAGIVLLPAAAQ